jgi:hypothetical protein
MICTAHQNSVRGIKSRRMMGGAYSTYGGGERRFGGEIKSQLKPENACYHSVQNLVCSSLICENLKIKI